MARYLLPPCAILTADRVLSATSERGAAIRQGPIPDTGNVGTLKLWADHVDPDVTPVALSLTMESGGNPEGYIPPATATAGARLTWRLNGEASSAQRAWVDRPFTSFLDRPAYNDGSNTYGQPSHLRTCHNGRAGFVAYDDTTNDTLTFFYKTDRLDAWSSVTIHTSTTAPVLKGLTGQPGLLITDAGRLIAYARVESPFTGASTDRFVAAWYSDDNGDTWTHLSSTAANLVTDSDIINAEWVNGSAVLVCGETTGASVDCYLSTSEGISFSLEGAGNTTLYRPRTTVYGTVVLIHADDNTGVVYQQSLSPGGNVDDESLWTEVTDIPSSLVDNKQGCLTTGDQGELWAVRVVDDTSGWSYVYYSDDGGANWQRVGQSQEATANIGLDINALGNAYTWDGLNAGMMGGNLVVLGRTQGVAAVSDGHVLAAYFGGWNRSFSEQVYGKYAGDNYTFHYWPVSEPSNLTWTKTTTGTGGTVSMTADGWNIAGSAGGNTDYSIPGNWVTAMGNGGNGVRVRCVVGSTSGGATTNARGRLRVQLSTGGSTAQWVELRFSAGGIAAYDTSGVLATDTGALKFSGLTEYIVIFERDGGATANTGLCTILYRRRADTETAAWTALLTDQEIAEDGSVSTNDIRFGGSVNATSDISLLWLGMAPDAIGVNLDSAALGRALSNSGAMYLDAGLAVGGYGTGAVIGDAYELSQVAAFPKEAIWSFPSPSEQCQSTDDTALWRVVFDAGANDRFHLDQVQLFGINFRTCKVEFNGTDSWGSPAVSVDVDSAVATYTLDGGEVGAAGLDLAAGAELVPHEYASKPGARYFMRFATSGNTYEILDNSETFLYVGGVDLSAESGDVTVFMDKAWVNVTQARLRYMAVTVAVQDTSDGYFSLGYVQAGNRVTMNAGDGSDAAWGWTRGTRTPVKVEKAANGYSSPTLLGGPQKLVMLPLLPSLDAVRSWHQEVAALHRYLGGPNRVVGMVLNSTETSFHNNGGLFRLTGTTQKLVNVYGEQDTLERVRASTLSFEEVV